MTFSWLTWPENHAYAHLLSVCMPSVCMLALTFYLGACPPPFSLLLSFTVYIEVAANGMFGAGKGGLIEPPNPAREFPLVLAELAVLNQGVYDLIMDLTVLHDMSKVWTYVF